MTAQVFAADEQTAQPVDAMRWVHLAEAVLTDEGAGDAEVSMLFVDETAMADLNKRFLGLDGPTDVLAFPIDEDPGESGRSPDSGGPGPGFNTEGVEAPALLGDVVICPAVAHRNAPEHAGTYEDEIALLVVHGLLHLLGMDHLDEEEAEVMERRERDLLARHHQGSPRPDPSPDAGDPSNSDPMGHAGGRTEAGSPPPEASA